MGILCSLIGHSWRECECARCQTLRHSWDGCKCTRCGEVRKNEWGHVDWRYHAWNGCVCIRCGQKRLTKKSAYANADQWDGTHLWSEKDCDLCDRCGSYYSDVDKEDRPEFYRGMGNAEWHERHGTRHSWGEWISAGTLRRNRTCKKCGHVDEQAWDIPGG